MTFKDREDLEEASQCLPQSNVRRTRPGGHADGIARGFTSSPPLVRDLSMDDYPTQFAGQLGAADDLLVKMHPGPLSRECVSEPQIMKERVLEAKYYAEEECTMKRLDSLLNHVLFGAVVIAFLNKYASTQPDFRLYPFHTKLVPGLYEVFCAIENGTFTSGTFLSVFAAPSFTLWALQGVIDACFFVSPLVVVAAIFGKWVLGHFTASSGEDGSQTRKRPLHDWPKHVRARVLSCLEALHVILALSGVLYCMCWITGQSPVTGTYIVTGVAIFTLPACICITE
ncbi:hypothetical protein K503DRAFT_857062 [Rhizopogon vinicolor AM-OR11-026]|uniref:Uncharacterized protein n=1 Tax=Rhizopogon vinicolor AM-OR11-026 TaxID=1314800 RepID=A0A1B7MZA1_9AGAM|nr:hypothetical protein K503DRAFT_857062 [Rhizopogon vinicolor AM-OR11-026]